MAVNKNYLQGIIFSLIASLSLGIVGIVDKLGTLQSSSPFLFSSQSLLFSLFFTTIFALVYFKGLPVRSIKNISFSSWGLIILVGILASGLFILFRFLGLTQSTGTFATLSQVITTSLTALLAWVFLKERLSKIFWILFAVIIFSMYFVSVGKIAIASIKDGDLLIILGTFFLATANILTRSVVQKVDPVLVSVGRAFIGFIFLFLVGLFFIKNGGIFDSLTIWVVLSGLLWSIMIITFNLAIKKIGITLVTSILMMASIITMALEYSLLGYQFTEIQVIAALVGVASGVAIIFASGNPKLSKVI